MKIVVIGGSGLIGKKLVGILVERGNEVKPASPSTGVDVLTGAGLAEALRGADVVVDVANAPSFEDAAVMSFFETSSRNILAAAAAAGVHHIVALSVVGADRLPHSGYMRAKAAQERAIAAGPIPFTIVRATQFFEFVGAIADGSQKDGVVRLSPAKFQPMAADDVAKLLADVVSEAPANAAVEIGGPEALPLDEAARRLFDARHDPRKVIADPEALYFGLRLDDAALRPSSTPRLGGIRFEEWLHR
jgi:uncharacterized protein YbjT (DUF2867 family)